MRGFAALSKEQLQANGRRGGVASGVTRRLKAADSPRVRTIVAVRMCDGCGQSINVTAQNPKQRFCRRACQRAIRAVWMSAMRKRQTFQRRRSKYHEILHGFVDRAVLNKGDLLELANAAYRLGYGAGFTKGRYGSPKAKAEPAA